MTLLAHTTVIRFLRGCSLLEAWCLASAAQARTAAQPLSGSKPLPPGAPAARGRFFCVRPDHRDRHG